MKLTNKELNKIADLIIEQATIGEIEEYKHLESQEDRKTWVENQIDKLDKGEVLAYENDKQRVKQRAEPPKQFSQ